MRVILDGFDGSFLPILQSFKAVMPSLRITGIEEIDQSVKDAPGEENEGNADAINVSELFARQDERNELLSDSSLFLQDDKFDGSGESAAVKFDESVKFEGIRANYDAKFEQNLMAKSERKIASAQEQNLQEMQNAMPYQDGSRKEKVILQTGSLSEAPKTAVPTGSAQTTAQQESSIFGGATQTASFGKTATSNQAAKTAVSDESAQAALFDFNESVQNLSPRTEPKSAPERKKHESASLFTDEEVRAILELK